MDKLRDGINRILFHILSNEERADKIMELIAPELEKAAKWDKMEEIARGFCNECPLKGCEQYEFVNPCEAVEDIVKTLNQPEVKPSPNGRGR